MLEGLMSSIRAEATHQRQVTTRRFTTADGSEYIVTLPNWRWGVLDRCRPDPDEMQRLLDLVLQSTALLCRPEQAASELFTAYLDDRVDFDAFCLRLRSKSAGNENFRTPWFIRVGEPAADNRGGLKDPYNTVFTRRTPDVTRGD